MNTILLTFDTLLHSFLVSSIVAFLLALTGTKVLISFLNRKNILDNPNERSNHSIPTPRGGGIAILFALFTVGIGLCLYDPRTLSYPSVFIIAGAALMLALVSFVDDIKPLTARWRLTVQSVAVAFGMTSLYLLSPSLPPLLFQGLLPVWLDNIIMAFIWLWFINLFNFMDGINGISGSQAICMSVGMLAIIGVDITIAISPASGHIIFYGASLLAASAAGFLAWNWGKAKIFMGDVGSVPLGFLYGFLLLLLASIEGYWLPALILPAYYLTDSSYTLLKRLLARKNIWEAHSEHFYQQAVRSGRSHPQVVRMIILANIVLIGASLLAAYGHMNPENTGIYCMIAAFLLAISTVFVLLRRLRK